MTLDVQVPDQPGPAGPRPGDGPRFHGVRTVAGLEFRMRIRTGRWRWVLGSWFVLLAVLTGLVRLALGAVEDETFQGREGIPTFGVLMLLLLGLSLLVVPALTAQSVNGDRERGVLATLQVTLLRPAEIALGKLLAAWGTALVFLVLALPMIGATMLMGGVGLAQVAGCLFVVAVLLGVVCALGQCLSALLARTVTSAVLSYLAVAALCVGTPIAFGLALATTTEEVTRSYQGPAVLHEETGQPIPGETTTYTETVTHPENVWWLLAPNPFVILADAAPEAPVRRDPRTGREIEEEIDPLSVIGSEVRQIRQPDDPYVDVPAAYSYEDVVVPEPDEDSPVWPYGLAFDAALGMGAVLLTIRRLRTPARKLPRGIRVA